MNKMSTDGCVLKKTSIRKSSLIKDSHSPKVGVQKSFQKEKYHVADNGWRSNTQSTTSLKDLQQNYKRLQSDYTKILDEIKGNKTMYEAQQKEVQKWRKIHEKDQKELYRLRSMIGFIKKVDRAVQVNMDDSSSGSWLAKIQKSTDGEYIKDDSVHQLWTPKKSRRKVSPNTIEKSSQKRVKGNQVWLDRRMKKKHESDAFLQKQRHLEEMGSTLTHLSGGISKKKTVKEMKKLSNSPYSKLRFVPSIDLN